MTTTDQDTVRRIEDFHGHMCPGLAMGIRASELALDNIGAHAADEEVVGIVETDMCGVDAIQVLTGCTFGKGNLVHRDWGKNAYTFHRRSDGKAVRIVGRPDAWTRDPEHQALFTKVRAGEATDAERERFGQLHVAESIRLLELEPDTLFTVTPVPAEAPGRARIHASVPCSRCGENVMETRLRRLSGADFCQPCFEAALGAS